MKQIKYYQLQSYLFISIYPRKDFYFFQTLKFFNRKDRDGAMYRTVASVPKDTSMDVVLRMSFTNAFPSKEAMSPTVAML